MNTPQKVYTFPNGSQVNLHRIYMIGAIDKDETYTIFIPVYYNGCNKFVRLTLGSAIGAVSPEQKERMEKIYNDFQNAWNVYTNHIKE